MAADARGLPPALAASVLALVLVRHRRERAGTPRAAECSGAIERSIAAALRCAAADLRAALEAERTGRDGLAVARLRSAICRARVAASRALPQWEAGTLEDRATTATLAELAALAADLAGDVPAEVEIEAA
jgi:hypothetical protein